MSAQKVLPLFAILACLAFGAAAQDAPSAAPPLDAMSTPSLTVTNVAPTVMLWLRGRASGFVMNEAQTGLNWARVAAVLLGFIIAGLAVRVFFARLARKEPEASGARLFFSRVQSLWSFLLLFSGVNLILQITGLADMVSRRFGDLLDFVNLFLIFLSVLSPLDVFFFNYYYPEKRNIRIPRLLQDVMRWGVYLVLLAYTFSVAFAIPLMPLFATSAVLSFILGFALQDTLSNLFAGLAIHFEGSFNIGDYVQAGGQKGQVAAITWRTIKIRTFEDDYMIVPNSTIAKNEIVNFSQPTPLTGRVINIGVSYDTPPAKVERVLYEIVSKVEGVVQFPEPVVRLTEYSDFTINYMLRFWVKDFSISMRAIHDINHLIWYHFKRENIEIPFPIRNVYMRQAHDPRSADALQDKARKLGRIDFLRGLNGEQLDTLARQMFETVFTKGETIIRQGSPNSRFYIIDEGSVDVRVQAGPGSPRKIASLSSGGFFGEHSLLTGESATATIEATEDVFLSALDMESFEDLLKVHPDIAESISHVIAQRALDREQSAEKWKSEFAQEQKDEEEKRKRAQMAESLSRRIRRFFAID